MKIKDNTNSRCIAKEEIKLCKMTKSGDRNNREDLRIQKKTELFLRDLLKKG